MNYIIVMVVLATLYVKAPGLLVAGVAGLALWSAPRLADEWVRRADAGLGREVTR